MITAQEVCAVVLTKDESANPLMLQIRESLAHFGELIVWDNSLRTDYKVTSRYIAAKDASKEIVYFQDDDVLLNREQLDLIVEHYEPGVLVSNMFADWIAAQGYFDLALVGLGAICDRGLWHAAFNRFFEAYEHTDDRFFQDRFRLDPDFIFGSLTPFKRYDFDAEKAIHMPTATAPDRLSMQPGQHERKFETINMCRKLRTVVGAVMFKNDEENIERAIRSVAPMCDSFVFLDTGCTDRTYDIAVATAVDLDKSFSARARPFDDFASSRNFLIEEARKHGDFFLMFDSDEEWVGNKELPPLAMDVLIVNYAGPIRYGHPRIIRSGLECKFEGQVHAALTWDDHVNGATVEGLSIVHHGDFKQGDADVQERLRRDVKLLSDEINNARDVAHNVFMRAKAYEGLGEWELARDDYELRLSLDDGGGEGMPAEQRFYAAFRLGVLQVEKFGDLADGADLLMSAWMDRPTRIESIRVLARYLNAVADATPIPETDMLFVHRDEYNDPKEG